MAILLGQLIVCIIMEWAVYQPDCFLHARRTHKRQMTAVITRMRRAAVPAVAPNVRGNVLTCSEEVECDDLCVLSVAE